MRIGLIAALVLVPVTGCLWKKPAADAPRATAVPAEQANPEYWLNQPGNVTIRYGDFDKLVDACEVVASRRGFKLDRADFRSALLTTKPLTASQIFEPFLTDNTTGQTIARANLATYRRTIFFEFAKIEPTPEGGAASYVVTPKVLIERQATRTGRAGPAVFSATAVNATAVIGSKEQDNGQYIPLSYWYATGRDAELERRLVLDLTDRLY